MVRGLTQFEGRYILATPRGELKAPTLCRDSSVRRALD